MRFLAVEEAKNVCGGVSYRFVWDRENFSSWFTHVAEHDVRERFWSRVAPGDVVLDVGAGFGSYTLPALARGAVQVYAWNPIASESNVLCESLKANGWADRCGVMANGLYSAPGWLVAYSGKRASDFFPAATFSAHHVAASGAFPVRTLDHEMAILCGGSDRLDWLKIDVEGAEAEVLKGAAETLRRFRPRVLVENHLFKDAAMEEKVKAVLAPLGYNEVGRIDADIISHVLWEAK